MEIILGTNEIAEFFDVTRKTMADWRKAGCPQISRGKWDLKQVHAWWWDNIAMSRAESQSRDDSLSEAKRKYWWEKARAEKTKNEQLAGSLIRENRVATEWAKRAAEFKAGCFHLVDMLPPLLEGKSQPEMRALIEDRVWSMFDRVTRTGQFCPTPEDNKK
jgi:phage terminase Nu1 subunit (DNA packaging protein)